MELDGPWRSGAESSSTRTPRVSSCVGAFVMPRWRCQPAAATETGDASGEPRGHDSCREPGVGARERKPKHHRWSGLGFRVASVRREELEDRASGTHAIKRRSIHLLPIWASSFCYGICKLMKSKPHILTYTKVYFIF